MNPNTQDATVLDASHLRRERGRALASDKRIKQVEGGLWVVPSATNADGRYLVNQRTATCSCPDFELRRTKCKHLWAAELTRTVETTADGKRIVTESIKLTRKTYAQPSWSAYHAAQCAEKATVQALLRGLCDGIVTPLRAGRGRPPLPLGDAVYSMVAKVYGTMSARRSTTDLRACATAGHIDRAPHFNSVLNYLGKPEVTPLLKALIAESAAPLATVESKFAVDSTGFSTSVFRRWYDAKYGRKMSEHTWIKAHAMVGVTTNIVTAVEVTDSSGADSPEFPGLVATTAQRFALTDVTADKAYLGHENLAAVEAVGAVPYVPFKVNSQGEGPAAWRRMWATFVYQQAEFLAHYHQRSNVESTFSAIKRKFGGAVRAKTCEAQVNEVLCKVLAYNLSVLVHAIFELGIEPTFPAARAAEVIQ